MQRDITHFFSTDPSFPSRTSVWSLCFPFKKFSQLSWKYAISNVCIPSSNNTPRALSSAVRWHSPGSKNFNTSSVLRSWVGWDEAGFSVLLDDCFDFTTPFSWLSVVCVELEAPSKLMDDNDALAEDILFCSKVSWLKLKSTTKLTTSLTYAQLRVIMKWPISSKIFPIHTPWQCFKLKFSVSLPEMFRKFPSLYNLL